MKTFKRLVILFVSFMIFVFATPPVEVEAATKLSNMSAKEIMKTLKNNGFPIDSYTIYSTNESDPNHLIGEPNAYKYKIDFWDKDYQNEYDDYSGTIEIFQNSSDASARKNYINSIYQKYPILKARMYQFSNVVLRIEYSVPAKRANYYKNAFSAMNKGKTPKYPLTINKKKLTLQKGKSATLKLNVSSKKAKWTSSNKKIVTVSKTGKVTAKKAGTATITAKFNGYTAKCKIKVPSTKDFLKTIRSNVEIETDEFELRDNEFLYGDFVSFWIYNETSKNITIGKTLKVYDDDYNYIGSVPIDNPGDRVISSEKSEIIGFYDESDKRLLYYGQLLVFDIKYSGETFQCYAEYTYDDYEPYSFTFHKP